MQHPAWAQSAPCTPSNHVSRQLDCTPGMGLVRCPALRSPLHRIPVLWSLYRPLLRSSRQDRLQLPAEHASALQSYIRQTFKQGRRLTGLDNVRKRLVEAEQVRSDSCFYSFSIDLYQS